MPDRQLYGDLADDVLLLRREGWTVCRSETIGAGPGLYRIGAGPRLCDADELRRRAAAIRARQARAAGGGG